MGQAEAQPKSLNTAPMNHERPRTAMAGLPSSGRENHMKTGTRVCIGLIRAPAL